MQRALESEVAGHARGGEEGILIRADVWGGLAQNHVRDGDGACGFREVPPVYNDRGVTAAQCGKSEDDEARGGASAGHA